MWWLSRVLRFTARSVARSRDAARRRVVSTATVVPRTAIAVAALVTATAPPAASAVPPAAPGGKSGWIKDRDEMVGIGRWTGWPHKL